MDDRLNDFRNVLYIVWNHLRLPEPTPVQYDIAYFLQNGPDRSIINAFRGVGKSWITIAFVAWVLKHDPNLKIEVVSASRSLADNFSTGVLNLIATCDLFEELRGDTRDRSWRSSKVQFDVNGSDRSKDPSVRSEGITGQITGSRADLIIADDIETPQTSETQHKRDKLFEIVKEFDSILKPGGRIIYLGTQHNEDSLYNELENRGYERRIWPAKYPEKAKLQEYGDRLAPIIIENWQEDRQGEPTDPKRFDEQDLAERELSYGKAGFAMQFMLDTSLSDAERYPLKLHDLIIDDVDNTKGYEKYIWARDRKLKIEGDLVCVGMRGDCYYAPFERVGVAQPYTGSIMFIDPAGRGADETGYAVSKFLNGNIFIPEAGGLQGGYSEAVLDALLDIAERRHVTLIRCESNFGDGMFEELLKGRMKKRAAKAKSEGRKSDDCYFAVEGVHNTTQKEKRIADALEPVVAGHRLIVDRGVIESDWETVKRYPADKRMQYSLFYQFTRLTREKGALIHDDRLDALASSVSYWVERMAINDEEEMACRELEDLDRELRGFEESAGVAVRSGGPTWSTPHFRR